MPARILFTPGDHALSAPEFRIREAGRGPAFGISGTTQDAAGAALSSCTVHLFRTSTDVEVDQVVSDGAGAYSFPNVTVGDAHFVVAYQTGLPDVAGTTVNTLTGDPVA